jgi:cysteine desulfurase
MVGAAPKDQVIFTSGASEANNTVVHSFALAGAHIVSTAIEHPCVLEPLRAAQSRGVSVSLVAPEPNGEVLASSLLSEVRPETKLISVMAANNETGVINRISDIARGVRANKSSVVVHTDAAQLVGKVGASFVDLGVDALTISGHKIGALSGIGALIVKEGISISPYILGGPQEGKLRGGTENLLGVISLGLAASDILSQGEERFRAMQLVRDAFEAQLLAELPDCQINGQTAIRLPNTTNVWVPRVRSDDLLVALDLDGIYVSSGAACSSGKPEPSHVLLAMGQKEERVRSTVRISFRADQGVALGAEAARRIAKVIKRMRN